MREDSTTGNHQADERQDCWPPTVGGFFVAGDGRIWWGKVSIFTRREGSPDYHLQRREWSGAEPVVNRESGTCIVDRPQ